MSVSYGYDRQLHKQQEALDHVVRMRKNCAESQKEPIGGILILAAMIVFYVLFNDQLNAFALQSKELCAAANWLYMAKTQLLQTLHQVLS